MGKAFSYHYISDLLSNRYFIFFYFHLNPVHFLNRKWWVLCLWKRQQMSKHDIIMRAKSHDFWAHTEKSTTLNNSNCSTQNKKSCSLLSFFWHFALFTCFIWTYLYVSQSADTVTLSHSKQNYSGEQWENMNSESLEAAEPFSAISHEKVIRRLCLVTSWPM